MTKDTELVESKVSNILYSFPSQAIYTKQIFCYLQLLCIYDMHNKLSLGSINGFYNTNISQLSHNIPLKLLCQALYFNAMMWQILKNLFQPSNSYFHSHPNTQSVYYRYFSFHNFSFSFIFNRLKLHGKLLKVSKKDVAYSVLNQIHSNFTLCCKSIQGLHWLDNFLHLLLYVTNPLRHFSCTSRLWFLCQLSQIYLAVKTFNIILSSRRISALTHYKAHTKLRPQALATCISQEKNPDYKFNFR